MTPATVRVRIIAAEGAAGPWRAAAEGALPGLDWRWPEYGYVTAPAGAAGAAALEIAASTTTGGEKSKLRAVARRGGAGIIVGSADPAAARWAARRLAGAVDWRATVAGHRADRLALRFYGVFLTAPKAPEDQS